MPGTYKQPFKFHHSKIRIIKLTYFRPFRDDHSLKNKYMLTIISECLVFPSKYQVNHKEQLKAFIIQ